MRIKENIRRQFPENRFKRAREKISRKKARKKLVFPGKNPGGNPEKTPGFPPGFLWYLTFQRDVFKRETRFREISPI